MYVMSAPGIPRIYVDDATGCFRLSAAHLLPCWSAAVPPPVLTVPPRVLLVRHADTQEPPSTQTQTAWTAAATQARYGGEREGVIHRYS